MPSRPPSLLLWLLLAFVGLPASTADAATGPLPRPSALEPDIEFWRRVYTEITTAQGFVHDDKRLDIVYATVPMTHSGSRRRGSQAEQTAARYVQILKKLATGKRTGLSAEEQRVLSLWGANVDNATLRAASGRVRIQRGQADKFREGLIRSGAWVDYIERTLSEAGVPKEIAALPHVESSFNPVARSHVGAAGLWQFMASTGRRYMRIDNVVDERLDPERASDAAALLMRHNFEVTESWPLAITAYNHGAGGMRRAVAQVGTRNIEKVVREYRSRTFGFASRNFYVSFVAALDVRNQAESYFGKLDTHPPQKNAVVILPGYAPADDLARALGVDLHTLAELNPSLKPSVWDGQKFVPKGFRLRLPTGVDDGDAWLASLDGATWQTRQTPDLFHVVQRGETLSTIAPRYGARVSDLVSLNALSSAHRIRVGQKLVLPAGAPVTEPVVADGMYAGEGEGTPSSEPAATVAAAPGVEQEAKGQGTTMQGEQSAPAADPNDYTVAADGTIRVQEGEALVHFATWLDTDAAALRTLNGLRSARLRSGQRLRLDFTRVPVATFEERRVDHHRELQERFFARYRIAGTNEHVVRRGESIWVLAERRYKVPIWLLRQYNPDIDLAVVKPGSRIVVPRLESRRA
jgi:membrane-bound lytic murein transglycosylase D